MNAMNIAACAVLLLLAAAAGARAALDGEIYDATDSVGENQLGLDVQADAVVYDIIGDLLESPEFDIEENLRNYNIECTPASNVLRFSVRGARRHPPAPEHGPRNRRAARADLARPLTDRRRTARARVRRR